MSDLDDFCEGLCAQMAQEGIEADAADVLRDSSSDTEESMQLFGSECETWWSRLLKEHGQAFDHLHVASVRHAKKSLEDLKDIPVVTVLSACSGLVPEASVFKAGQ